MSTYNNAFYGQSNKMHVSRRQLQLAIATLTKHAQNNHSGIQQTTILAYSRQAQNAATTESARSAIANRLNCQQRRTFPCRYFAIYCPHQNNSPCHRLYDYISMAMAPLAYNAQFLYLLKNTSTRVNNAG
jgi:hypothetical protein